jgi:hypothetical protein
LICSVTKEACQTASLCDARKCKAVPRTKINLTPVTALDLMERAAQHMRDRAVSYDKPEGERSMGQTIAAFNAITGRDLKETEGWLLMQILKDVRLFQRRDTVHMDSLEDCIAYAALKGESMVRGGA